jgi:pimeloyl-ACP methyl ester carboxylesterase
MLDTLRSGQEITDEQVFGPSLVEFVRSQGGILPSGELHDADMNNRPFQRNLVQPNGLSVERAATLAVEAGYFPGMESGAITETDLLDALDLRGVHVVGMSLGGWIGLEVAVRNTSRLASLTVIGAAGIRPGDIPTGDLFMWSPEDRIRNLVADPALAEKILALPQTPEQQDTALRNFITTAKLAWEPRFFDPHLEKWLHRLRLPTHVIWGREDRLFPPDYGRRLASLIPGARFSVIDRCGHLPQVERPTELTALVRQLAHAA